jgi:hypothetical protein
MEESLPDGFLLALEVLQESLVEVFFVLAISWRLGVEEISLGLGHSKPYTQKAIRFSSKSVQDPALCTRAKSTHLQEIG